MSKECEGRQTAYTKLLVASDKVDLAMTDITERIARAIFFSLCGDWQGQCNEWEIIKDEKKAALKYYLEAAEALIEILKDDGAPIDKLISGEYVAVPVAVVDFYLRETKLRAGKSIREYPLTGEECAAMIQAHRKEGDTAPTSGNIESERLDDE